MVRHVIHLVVAVLLWVVFAVYWQLVMMRPMSADTRAAVMSLALLALLGMLYLVLWIRHNVRLSRRLQRRKARRTGAMEPVRDYLGRWIVFDRPDILRHARYIVVEVKKAVSGEEEVEEKVFRSTQPLDPALESVLDELTQNEEVFPPR